MEYVFVVYRDDGLEGCSRPIRAFSTEPLASLFAEGANETGGRLRVAALFVETPEQFSSGEKNEPHSMDR